MTLKKNNIRLYNTLTRAIEPFEPAIATVSFYSCGPTVYATPHLGNWRTFVVDDLIRRWLRFNGYEIKQAMNITDVDDKTIRGAKEKGTTLENYTKPFIDQFHAQRNQLRIEDAEYYPKATKYVTEMANLVAELLKQEKAYKTEDGIYFRVSSFPNYGKLAHITGVELKPSGRVPHDEYDKEQIADFALWKAWDPEDGGVYWPKEGDSPPAGGWPAKIPKGRPGWHIECSAMLQKLLGETVDLHTGGVDNIFPHHQNEVAQSEALTGKPLARHWLHVEHLLMNGEKMAKSKGNVTELDDVLQEGFDPLDVRYLLLAAHYRSPLDFTEASLIGARNARVSLKTAAQEASGGEGVDQVQKARKAFLEALQDDLNTPDALAALHQVAKAVKADSTLSGAKQLFEQADQILGLGLFDSQTIPAEVEKLVGEREAARKAGDFARSDQLRSKITDLGFQIDDTPHGPRILPN